MSKYGTLETEIKEQKYLIGALAEMGYHPEVHGLTGAADTGKMRVMSGRKGRTSSYGGGSWTRRRTISVSQRRRTADNARAAQRA